MIKKQLLLVLMLLPSLALTATVEELQEEIVQLRQRMSTIHIDYQSQLRQQKQQQSMLEKDFRQMQNQFIEQQLLLLRLTTQLGISSNVATAANDRQPVVTAVNGLGSGQLVDSPISTARTEW